MSQYSSSQRPRPLLAVALLIVFFATGASGLIYQVAWQRYLLNVFGSTIYSISTVLAAFMGGLALGSLLFGRVAERTRRQLTIYGVLEICIGLAALLVPYLLRFFDPVFVAAYQKFGSNFLAFSVIRFVLVFGVLLIPTTMMGGTLPLLARFVSPDGQGAGLRVGLLYALNTAGAVIGTILSGFYLIRLFGVSNTVLIAVIINVTAGCIAILLGATLGKKRAEEEPMQAPAKLTTEARLVLIAYAVSGFAALGLEVVWSRALVYTFDLLKNTTYSFTAMLAVFLVGIAAGSAVMTPFVERQRNPFRLFGALQVVIGLASVFSFFVLYYYAPNLGDAWFREYDAGAQNIRWTASLALVFLRTAVTMFLPTFLMGMAFPVAVRAVTTRGNIGRNVGRLYAYNTLGAIVGSAGTGFVMLPILGIANTIFFLGALQAVVGIALLMRKTRSEGEEKSTADGRGYVIATVAAVALIVAFARLPEAIFQPIAETDKLAFYKEGPLATVAVLQNSLGYRTIYIDNNSVAGTDPMLLTDQKSLAHVPALLLKNPKSALTVGFGSGGASYSYTLHPNLQQVDCVEITKTVVEASPTLTDSNHNVVMYEPEYRKRTGKEPQGFPLFDKDGKSGWFKADKRYRVILDDARSYLRFTPVKYDIIATDCTDLRYKSNANLYDVEYFQLTRDKITDDGMVVVWMPLAGLSEDAFKVALRSFYKVFPEMEVFYMNNEPTHYILLIGTKGPLKVDANLIKERLKNPAVKKDLAEIKLDSAEKILSCFIVGREKLGELLKGKTLNTEDFPYLEFESPRYGYGDKPLLDNLDLLYKFREDPARIVESPDPQFKASLERYAAAVPYVIDGCREYRNLRIAEATRAWMKAHEICPEDEAVANMLNFEELQRKVRGQPGSLWSRLMLGNALAMQGRDSEAAGVLNGLVEYAKSGARTAPADGKDYTFSALTQLARLYERTGRKAAATEYQQQADALAARGAKPVQ